MGKKSTMDKILEQATWRELPPPTGPAEAQAYQGIVAPAGFVITVVAWDLEPQGGEPGSMGYDGAVGTPRGTIIRLTREQAEKAFNLAKSA